MTGKIFRSTLAASLTVLLASLLVITGCLYTYFGTVREQQLQTELTLAAAAVEADGADYLARVRDTAERLTWVASDGAVLYDTRTDTQPMENHGQREEIREALTGGSGSSARYSETLTEKMLYQAVRLTDGSVLRISGSQKTVWMLVLGMLHAVNVVALLAVGLSALLASRAARRVVEPLAVRRHGAAVQVHRKAPGREHMARVSGMTPPQHRLHPGHHLHDAEGLHQIVVCP